uniref:Uncharacterized protein n=1 Tax=Babesia bovis TaxID=5865 RepID=S6B6E7_BABBO|nr:hypothetical protein [Babesia bovis]
MLYGYGIQLASKRCICESTNVKHHSTLSKTLHCPFRWVCIVTLHRVLWSKKSRHQEKSAASKTRRPKDSLSTRGATGIYLAKAHP